MTVDIIFLSHNRKEFTQISLEELIKNTSRNLVGKVHVVDDGSMDGGREWLKKVLPNERRLPVSLHLVSHNSVVETMNHGVRKCNSEFIAKIDNDTVVPPRWLEICLSIMSRHAELSMLGIDAKNVVKDVDIGKYGYTPTDHIGGIGLFRSHIFYRSMPQRNKNVSIRKYHGFTEWQWRERHFIKGWINPGIPVILLDRVPVPPFPSLVKKYQKAGSQRGCGPYPNNESFWKWRFPDAS